ncbi:MAG: EamA family transporter [Actinomycetota bacterium]|nr:EamA family transporter [Actinomycetota bacterium]
MIREVGPAPATIITYVNPAVAVVLGAVFLHESLRAPSIVGFIVVLAGSVLATARHASRDELPLTIAEP